MTEEKIGQKHKQAEGEGDRRDGRTERQEKKVGQREKQTEGGE